MEVKNLQSLPTIMVVNKDEIGQMIIEKLFRIAGFRGHILQFIRIEDALMQIRLRMPDMVIVDFFQTESEDFLLLKQLSRQAKSKRVNIIVLWDYFKSYVLQLSNPFSVSHFFRKPMTIEQARQCIRELEKD